MGLKYQTTVPYRAQKFLWDLVGEKPTPLQDRIHREGGRFVIIGGGERAGKSRTLARHLFSQCQFGELFWIVGPDYEQTHREFIYLLDWLRQLKFVQKGDWYTPKRGSWSVVINRTKDARWEKEFKPFGFAPKTEIITKTAKETLALAMEAPDGILVVEPGQIDSYETIIRLRGRVAETRGWLWLGGTFEYSADWLRDLWESWSGDNPWGGQSFSLPTWSNTIIFPKGRQDPEILKLEQIYPPDQFMERFGGRPYKPTNLVIPEFDRERHVSSDVSYTPGYPVEVWIDPGFDSYYAVAAVQLIPRGDIDKDAPEDKQDEVVVQVIDTVYQRQCIVHQIINMVHRRPWARHVQSGVIDIAGKTKKANKSQVDIWWEDGGIALDYNFIAIEDGILRHRNVLMNNRLIYASHCEGLGEYRRWVRHPKTHIPSRSDCDLLKAISYGLVARLGVVEYEPRDTIRAPWSF